MRRKLGSAAKSHSTLWPVSSKYFLPLHSKSLKPTIRYPSCGLDSILFANSTARALVPTISIYRLFWPQRRSAAKDQRTISLQDSVHVSVPRQNAARKGRLKSLIFNRSGQMARTMVMHVVACVTSMHSESWDESRLDS